MAQTASMGPPLSPRETRRSGRRSAPSVSASKSPDSDQPPSRPKESTSRVISSSASMAGRNKKPKQEECDEIVDDRKNYPASVASMGSNNGNNAGKSKRKAKDKDKDKDKEVDKDKGVEIETEKEKQISSVDNADPDTIFVDGQTQEPAEEEEQGITRCVCGSTEDDPDAGEFMVQCETCKVWQHGLCMGYQSEDQVHDDDYYCEQCRPELHVELLKKLARRPRQTSASSRQESSTAPRVSRSHSPSHLLKQPSKRRNTMNSRDAAFDESLKEIIEATAAEAAAGQDNVAIEGPAYVIDINEANKKKRKRADDDGNSKKRTRSASTASDTQNTIIPQVETLVIEKPPTQPLKAPGRNKRGSRKTATIDSSTVDAEEANLSTGKRQGNSTRAKAGGGVKRPPLSHSVSQGSGTGTHDHGTRRSQGSGQHGGQNANESARAYRNSHAYAVSQQALFTSWGLPDYLSHLEEILPTDIPQPLEVRSGVMNASGSGSRGQSAERTMERGVKVKWPSKRMSVGDMNKRVRALVEWVGREQANALDRSRRREALEMALRLQISLETTAGSQSASMGSSDTPMAIDESTASGQDAASSSTLVMENALEMSMSTMKTMEGLMEELIGFQERFGPGAKSRDKERKAVTVSTS